MKKRNLVIVAFMLVAAMTIGVGYAALNVELNISGTASVTGAAAQEEFTEDVYFSNARIVTTTGTHTGDAGEIKDTITTEDSHTVTFQANTLMGIQEYVEYEITVKNDSTLDATVTPNFTETDDNSAFNVEVTGITDATNFVLAANGGTQIITVRITLEKMPTDPAKTYNLSFGINLNAVIDN